MISQSSQLSESHGGSTAPHPRPKVEKWLVAFCREIGYPLEKLFMTNVDKLGISSAESSSLWESKQKRLAGYWTRLRGKVAAEMIIDRINTLANSEQNPRVVIYSFAAASGYHEQRLRQRLNSLFPHATISWVISDSNGVAVIRAIERFAKKEASIRARRLPFVPGFLNDSMSEEILRQERILRSSALKGGLTAKIFDHIGPVGRPGILRFDVTEGLHIDLAPFQTYALIAESDFAGYHKIFKVLGLLEFFPELIIPLLAVARVMASSERRSFIVTSQTVAPELAKQLSFASFLPKVVNWIANQKTFIRLLGGQDPFVARRNTETDLFNRTYTRYCDDLSLRLFGGHALAVSAEVRRFELLPT